jgi:hypothetical protein
MATVANSIECRLFCAARCAYGIDANTGKYTAPPCFTEGVGWANGSPIPISSGAGDDDIDACLVGANVDGIIIAFRGTIYPALNWPSILDWLQNIFMVAPSSHSPVPGSVHTGFWNAVQAIWAQIVTQVQALMRANPNAKLYITGHSKGGGMAIIAAALIYFTQNPGIPVPTAVYTYAAPHAGDSTFASNFPLAQIPVIPYENYLDLVPFLPPTAGFFIFLGLFHGLPAWLLSFFQQAANWDYSALNTTYYYIQKNYTVVPNTMMLTFERVSEILATMAILNFNAIADAHSSDCGSGYASGSCPNFNCKPPKC